MCVCVFCLYVRGDDQLLYTEQALPHLCVSVFVGMCECVCVYVCVCVCVLFVCAWGYLLLYTEQALPHLCMSVFVCMCVYVCLCVFCLYVRGDTSCCILNRLCHTCV
jgi:hypothetical protein